MDKDKTKEELFEAWLDKLVKKGKYKQQRFNSASVAPGDKSYRHLDSAVALDGNRKGNRLVQVLKCPEQVSRRSFYPFLKIVLEKPRFTYHNQDGKRLKEKAKPKPRDIYYAAHADALIYSWYAYQLSHHYDNFLADKGISDCSLAYRSIRKQTTIHFANTVFSQIATYDNCVVMAFDVSKFFDHLNHDILKQNWARVIDEAKLPPDHFTIFKSLTRFRYLKADTVKEIFSPAFGEKKKIGRYCYPEEFRQLLLTFEHRNQKPYGIPQGSPLSAVLANIYMVDFDAHLQAFANSCGGLYRRYSDDILLVVPEQEMGNAQHIVQHQLNKVHLPLNQKKTEIRYFRRQTSDSTTCTTPEGKEICMQYLGLEYDGNVIRVRSASWARYHQKLRKAVRRTVRQATGKRSKGDKVFMRKLYRRFTSLSSKSNFITYVQRVENITGSDAVKNQYKNHVPYLQRLVKQEYEKAQKEKAAKAAKGGTSPFVHRPKPEIPL